MSKVFDPEKVLVYQSALTVPATALGGFATPVMFQTAKVNGVREKDYRALLALYRELQRAHATLERLYMQSDFARAEKESGVTHS